MGGGYLVRLCLRFGGQSKIAGRSDAVVGFKQSGFKYAGQFAHIARPVVMKRAGKRARSKQHRPLLVAGADTVEQGLRQRSYVFSALPQRRNPKSNRSEPKRKVGKKLPLSGHLAKRSLR